MAMIEMNALSTVLCGSFSAKVFFPEMDKLGLGENDYDKKYPVLWLYHSDGGSSMDWLCTPAEKCAAENGILLSQQMFSTVCVPIWSMDQNMKNLW